MGRTRTSEIALEAEAWLLENPGGNDLLAEVIAVPRPGPADLARWRRLHPREQVEAALRMAECRRRAGAKFRRADRMWLDPIGLEQATAEPVARHKAGRFAGAPVVADLCCGIGGDALALGAVARLVVPVDADPGMARRAAWNALVYDVAGQVAPVAGRAERFRIPPKALVHIDPDRRAGDVRARSLRDYVPGWPFLASLMASTAGGALKLGPASDFDARLGPNVEIELISLDGECKEATAWFGRLAGGRRRATVLPAGATWTDRDGPLSPRLPVIRDAPWAFDPDPALVRSGLLDGFAAAHGLGRIAPGVDLLGGEHRVDSPFLAAFEVLETLPIDLKRLRRLVADRALGPLEIKIRGLDLRPETLRPQLRPPGPNPATLLLLGGPQHGRGQALLARRPPARDGSRAAPGASTGE